MSCNGNRIMKDQWEHGVVRLLLGAFKLVAQGYVVHSREAGRLCTHAESEVRTLAYDIFCGRPATAPR